MLIRFGATLFAAIGLFLIGTPVLAHDLNRAVPIVPEFSRPGDVRIWDAGFTTSTRFTALPASVKYGGALASGDIDGDGNVEIVVSAGFGAEPYVNIFTPQGTKIRAFAVDALTNKSGVRVAVADVNGDGKAEIVVSFGAGVKPTVKIYSATGDMLAQADVYGSSFFGGVHLATADVDQDGKADIVTSPGPGGGPHIRIFNGDLTTKNLDFFAFDPLMRDGTSITTIRSQNGPLIVAAPESWSAPLVRQFSVLPQPSLTKEFYVYNPFGRSGVVLASVDIDHDGNDEIATARNGSEWPDVSVYDVYGTKIQSGLVLDQEYRGGIALAALASDRSRIMTLPTLPIVVRATTTEKSIVVNIKEQRLYAYEHGRLARTFLVSTGTYKYPTPIMTTTVLTKTLIKRYAFSYGKNHPDNYDLPNVKYNLQIKGPYFIHYAYWHNNFGHRMSHGCVNVGLKDSEWIFNWADVGTPVETKM